MKQLLSFFLILVFSIYLFALPQAVKGEVNSTNRTSETYSQQTILHNNTTDILSQKGKYFEFYIAKVAIAARLPSNLVVKNFKLFEDKVYLRKDTPEKVFVEEVISDNGYVRKKTYLHLKFP